MNERFPITLRSFSMDVENEVTRLYFELVHDFIDGFDALNVDPYLRYSTGELMIGAYYDPSDIIDIELLNDIVDWIDERTK